MEVFTELLITSREDGAVEEKLDDVDQGDQNGYSENAKQIIPKELDEAIRRMKFIGIRHNNSRNDKIYG